jgi:hypothetical protein
MTLCRPRAYLLGGPFCSLETVSELRVRRLTLKAFANFSPGFALKPWVQKTRKRFFATLKELRRLSRSPTGDATHSGLRLL